MKSFIAILTLFSYSCFSQVGIGTITPNATLEIQSSNPAAPLPTDGLLIPQVDEFPSTAPSAAQDGIMVYATGNGSVTNGFYYWDNSLTNWVKTVGATSLNGLTDGKSDTNGTSLFLGINAGMNDDGTDNNNIGIGQNALQNTLSGGGNTGIGHNSLLSNTTGYGNSAIGRDALYSIDTGIYNVGVGLASLAANTTGIRNTAIGTESLRSNVDGDYNIAIGSRAGLNRSSGDQNVIIGSNSGASSTNSAINGSVFLGHSSGYDESNDNRLYIENSNSTTPLIYGEFDNDVLGFNGDVAIGHQTPAAPLHVESEGTSGTQEIIAALGSNTSNRPVLQFSESSFTNLSAGMSLEYDGRGSSGANRMVINGIGGNPLFEFRNGGSLTLTGGSMYVNHPSGAGSEGLTLVNNTDTDAWRMYVQWNSNTLALMYNNANVGNFDEVSGIYTAVSDRNRKKNIAPTASVLDKIQLLEVKDYGFKNQLDNKRYTGLIAQDVEKLFPHLVVPPNEEINNYTMDYSGFGVLAIKAIQEQQEQIETLKQQLEHQKEELMEIKALLSPQN